MSCGNAHTVISDLTVSFCSPTDLIPTCTLDPLRWHRIEKDLCLHTAQQSAWLHVRQDKEAELTADELVVVDVRVDELPGSDGPDSQWESRPCDIRLLRRNYTGDNHQAMTGVDILFGVDAVDPRPQWTVLRAPLLINARREVPSPRLSVRYGRAMPKVDRATLPLRVTKDGRFKIAQISDAHMVAGVGICRDAININSKPLPECEADPKTIQLLEGILDLEKPDLVVLTGDQLDSQVLDAQSAIFKLVAPLIKRSIPYAAAFGNHDDEGPFTLSRMEQMPLLQDLPLSLCQPCPEQVDGVGNYYLQILALDSTELPSVTLYFLDTHGEIPNEMRDPDYSWIKQSQIDWFTCTSQELGKAREKKNERDQPPHLSLAFMHIPLPEYADRDLIIIGEHWREPTEGPSFNSRFYDVLAKEGVVTVGCGHDHVNDFCGLRPGRPRSQPEELQGDGEKPKLVGPWLCYAGGIGFGGYGSYGGQRYHRRARIWEVDTKSGTISSWKRVEHFAERIDEIVLVENGAVVAPPHAMDEGTTGVAA